MWENECKMAAVFMPPSICSPLHVLLSRSEIYFCIYIPINPGLALWITLEIECYGTDKVPVLVYFLSFTWNSAQLPYGQAQTSLQKMKCHVDQSLVSPCLEMQQCPPKISKTTFQPADDYRKPSQTRRTTQLIPGQTAQSAKILS